MSSHDEEQAHDENLLLLPTSAHFHEQTDFDNINNNGTASLSSSMLVNNPHPQQRQYEQQHENSHSIPRRADPPNFHRIQKRRHSFSKSITHDDYDTANRSILSSSDLYPDDESSTFLHNG
eukprot:CAMPEP_0172322332 /NCGR_PEP_ID=MMETSP1058-20130122/45621_1 /TAXON_ID=83371 /ORGANISM="Detonula confervacea, Strain CCMP 353" /LENGTH=120 /DNA_ID=CAMNT_0013038053 /DNA_START=72 /DNA_END=430 /DNA_ORIENTATION=+